MTPEKKTRNNVWPLFCVLLTGAVSYVPREVYSQAPRMNGTETRSNTHASVCYSLCSYPFPHSFPLFWFSITASITFHWTLVRLLRDHGCKKMLTNYYAKKIEQSTMFHCYFHHNISRNSVGNVWLPLSTTGAEFSRNLIVLHVRHVVVAHPENVTIHHLYPNEYW